jgi:hypothetical protein
VDDLYLRSAHAHALLKTKRKIISGVVALLVVAYIISVIPTFRQRSEWKRTVQALRDLPREHVTSAIQSFVRAQKTQGRSISETVSLRELVAGGFISTEDAVPFAGADVTFAIRIDERSPQQIIARVPLSNGHAVVVELADGSIQVVSRSALERQDSR